MDQVDVPHLFRSEFRRITSSLCRYHGIAHLQLAEDIASETFLAALETWPYRGKPDNPAAWLHRVARNKALNLLKRAGREQRTDEVVLATDMTDEAAWSTDGLHDSQLRMMFALSHPSLPAESQVGLALRILCGFGIQEIASAFLASEETISKRLYRAREILRIKGVQMEFPETTQISQRLDAVLNTLYLLYSEGYYSECHDTVLREDLCFEAMHLVRMLMDYPPANTPATRSLYALMCFHASRFRARKQVTGELILYNEQDRSQWDHALIAEGSHYLHLASSGDILTRYHVEATIAWWLTVDESNTSKWPSILSLYEHLQHFGTSPMVLLNRNYALYKVEGAATAISETEKLGWMGNQFYHALLAVLYAPSDPVRSQEHYQETLKLVKTRGDIDLIRKKLT
ncbi:MAG: sigma-70 family RNA polymerase sigma factor [Cyclobacteriaceae bacterium]|nr:sigma-70 family RNA polymerase sigma factor [Cyclobacteriaceae bacterium]